MIPASSSFFTLSRVGAGLNPISLDNCAFVIFAFSCKISRILRSMVSNLYELLMMYLEAEYSGGIVATHL